MTRAQRKKKRPGFIIRRDFNDGVKRQYFVERWKSKKASMDECCYAERIAKETACRKGNSRMKTDMEKGNVGSLHI